MLCIVTILQGFAIKCYKISVLDTITNNPP